MPALVIRVAIGLLLIVHGVAHYKITTAWGTKEVAEAPLLSALGMRAPAIQSLGNAWWMVALFSFIVAGLVVLIYPAAWQATTIVASVVSLALIALYWMPKAALGAMIDLGTLVALVFLRWPTNEMVGA
jgi:hypothetical protein